MAEDFSFVGPPPSTRPNNQSLRTNNASSQQQQQQGGGTGAGGGNASAAAAAAAGAAQQQRMRFAVPSASEVAAREQQRGAVPLYFRPSSAAAAGGPGVPGGTGPSSLAAAAAGPPPQPQSPPPAPPPAPTGAAAFGMPASLPHYVEGQPGAPRLANSGAPPPAAPPPPAHAAVAAAAAAAASAAGASGALLVSPRQQGNPLLKHVRMVRWQYADITADYQMGHNAAAVFISLRYHLLHPTYALPRLKSVARAFRLLVLLVHVDTDDAARPLRELTRLAVGLDAALVCGFSAEECARYLELLKAYENKPAAAIQGARDTDYVGRLTAALTSVRGVNRNDAYTVGAAFGTLADAFRAGAEQFAACPGLGPVKARRLHDAFSKPFRRALAAPVAAGAAAAAAAGAAVASGDGGGGGTGAAGAAGAASLPGVGGSGAETLTQGVVPSQQQQQQQQQQLQQQQQTQHQQQQDLPISDDDDGGGEEDDPEWEDAAL